MSHTSKTHHAARIILGLLLVTTGLNGFFGFLPMPEGSPQGAEFMGMLVSSGFMYVVKVLELTAGILLVIGRREVLALTILGPLVVNFMLFHIFFEPGTIFMGLLAFGLWCFVTAGHWSVFRVLLTEEPERRVRATPSTETWVGA